MNTAAIGELETDGQLLVSPVAHRPSLERMGVPLGERVFLEAKVAAD